MSDKKPVIEFEAYKIINIDYKVYDDLKDLEKFAEDTSVLSAWVGINEEEEHAQIKLKAVVSDEDNLRSITVEVAGAFKINDKKDVKSHLTSNGTAILLPYLRSIVSMVSSFDNKNAILLPTFRLD
ncbi:hypothetical protein [Abiotrophia defectiva]|uniref:hypothetical protein n=1 Tax=Abiotrophia defectiva TaxID=46125 RepID=UPI0028D70461|nr:hypothetical protein [Abiotrophia defectiva]